MNTTTKSRKGFTLIELVVTIVLLGALAAIASVSYSAFLSDARGEIAAIEAVQGDRIAAAQALLDEEGEYQATVPDAPVMSGTVTVSPGSSPGFVNATFYPSWTAPASDGGSPITGYYLESSSNNGSSWSLMGGTTLPASVTTLPLGISNVPNGFTFQFRVAAVNAVGTSDWSNIVSLTASL
jgi:prepilin-type N-terminal cleavage/methylation domain-containing protein